MINLRQLAADKPLVKKIQESLTLSGYLDPEFIVNKDLTVGHKPADGILGPNTEAAIRSFIEVQVTPEFNSIENKDIFPLILGHTPKINLDRDDAAAKIIAGMMNRGYYVTTNPNNFNIVYLEGVSRLENGSFKLNDNAVDGWNDLRMLIRIDYGGRPIIEHCFGATTGPGKPYILNPMNPDGCARIKLGQYKAWVFGKHKGTQDALQQNGPIVVCRDLNKDGQREGDKEFLSVATINQHTTNIFFDKNEVGYHSAGCLVGKNHAEHYQFMAELRGDSRYESNNAYQFITTVMDGRWIF